MSACPGFAAALPLSRSAFASSPICVSARRGAAPSLPRRRVRTVVTAAASSNAGAEQEVAAEMIAAASERMAKTIEATAVSFNTIRTGRASASILDRIMVSYYGAETPLKQLANVNTSGSSTIVVDPYDKTGIKDIERALMESDVGITPSNDGSIIRLAVPPLTQDRRKELAKKVKALAEDGRVALRNIRRDAVEKCKKLEKSKDMGQDDSKTIQDKLQKETDKFVKQIDSMLKEKDKDIMTV
jgi:ribosome recycling factor